MTKARRAIHNPRANTPALPPVVDVMQRCSCIAARLLYPAAKTVHATRSLATAFCACGAADPSLAVAVVPTQHRRSSWLLPAHLDIPESHAREAGMLLAQKELANINAYKVHGVDAHAHADTHCCSHRRPAISLCAS